jgi:hypothetical protein
MMLVHWFQAQFGHSDHIFEAIFAFLIVPAQFGVSDQSAKTTCDEQLSEVMQWFRGATLTLPASDD